MKKVVIQYLFLTTISIVFCFSRPAVAQNFWEQVNSPTRETLNRVCFADSLKGWAVGENGTILHTVDGGETWLIQNSTITGNIADIFFLNDRLGWAIAWNTTTPPPGSILLKTVDGGDHWTPEIFKEAGIFLRSVSYLDSLNGWMSGSDGTIVYTTDGGGEWINAQLDTTQFTQFPVIDLKFADRKNGFASGGFFDLAGVIWQSSDSGKNWSAKGVGPEPIQQLVVLDSLNVIGVGGDFEFGASVVRTSDGGQTWEYCSLQTFGIATGISFRTNSEIWVSLGTAQKFILSTDGGDTWLPQDTPNNANIFDVAFADSLHGIAVGNDGVILRYNPIPTALPRSPKNLPVSPVLQQNYPNPFNPETNFKFQISTSGFVTITLYDVTGKRVATLVNENKSPDEYTVPFSGNGLQSGVYFYRLRLRAHDDTAVFFDTKKMLLIR